MPRRKKDNSVPQNARWNTALYLRLSKEDGNEVSLSIENQKKRLVEYVTNQSEAFEIAGIYVDDGISGTTTDEREAFNKMIADIDSREINCVVVKDLSRLSRNLKDTLYYIQEYFLINKVRFVSLELPNLDSHLDPDGINSLLVAFQGILNESHPRETSIKVRNTFNKKRRDGDFIGAFAPYGYAKDPVNKSHLVIDPEASEVVQDIYKMFLSGMSKGGIARNLNNLAIPCPAAYKKSKGLKYKNPHVLENSTLWNASTIKAILENRVYIGDMVQGRYKTLSYKIHTQVRVPQEEWFIVDGTHEPIITHTEFARVQELLLLDVKAVGETKEVYKFGGLLKCADCGRAMRRKKTKGYVYYVCRTYHDLSKSECTNHSINETRLEKAILQAVQTQLKLVGDIQNMITEIEGSTITKNESIRINQAIAKKEEEIISINQIRDNLYNDWQMDIITKEDYFRMRSNYDTQLQDTSNTITELGYRLNLLESAGDSNNSVLAFYKQFHNIEALDRAILVKLVEKIQIHDKNNISVTFRFDDQLQIILANLEENPYVKKLSL